MSKILLRRIVDVVGIIACFIMVLITKVSITTSIGDETSNPLYKGYFEFITDSGNAGIYGFARFMMILGFILVVFSVIYFSLLLVLTLLKKVKVIENVLLISKVMNFIAIGGILCVLISGVFNHEYTKELIGHISLVGFPWFLSLVFSFTPFISKYFIKL